MTTPPALPTVDHFDRVAAAFSRKADEYDAFGDDHLNLARMRRKVYDHVLRFVCPTDRLLELNAGTGIDAAFFAETLDSNGIVIDIGCAHEALKTALAPLNYRNLDDVTELRGKNTTTEFLTKHIFDSLAGAAREGRLGRNGRELKALRVTLSESHVARAWYEASLW